MSSASAPLVHPALWCVRDEVRSSAAPAALRSRTTWTRVGHLRRELSDTEQHIIVQALLEKARSDEVAAETLVSTEEPLQRQRDQLLALSRLASALADVLEDVDAVCLLDRS
jgi:hypothetical protein